MLHSTSLSNNYSEPQDQNFILDLNFITWILANMSTKRLARTNHSFLGVYAELMGNPDRI